MATIEDDSTDDEIGVNLQLAERLSINKGEHVSTNKSPIDKAIKQLQNYHKQKHHHDYQSSSSSSLDTHNDPLLMEGASAYGLHNKKRQNGDKNVEQFTNSKRTCLGDRLLRSPDWKMNNDDVPEVVYFSSQPTNSSARNLFPDKTYEDHLNNASDGDDSDFKPRKHLPSKNFPQNSGESSKTYRNFSLPKTTKHSKMFENQASGSNGVQFIDSTSDDDSRTLIQNGALKGGRQSPDLNTRKKLWNRKITKFLDSDSDDGQVDYRSRPVLFSSSSDSDDSRPNDKTNKQSNLPPKRSSPKISFIPGPVNKLDHSYYMRDETLRSRLNRAGPSHQFNPPIPSSSEYRPRSPSKPHKSHNKALPSDAAYQDFIPVVNEIEAPFHGRGDTHTQKTTSRNPGSTQPRNLRGNRQPSVRNYPKGIIEPRPLNQAHSAEPVRSDVYNGSSNDATISPFRPDSFIPRGTSNIPYHAGEGSHSVRSPVSRPITTRHRHRPNKMKSLKGRSALSDAKNNLASIYPDLFDAEDSSEVEFFTANSYSDNESNTESLNSLRMNAMSKDQPVQNQETVEVNPVSIGSSEDEISVVFSSAPHQRIDQRRASRTLGRRYRRCPHGFRPTAQDVVSISPDPVEQVRQVEEDERFARMLQAQFDAEVDPNYTPPPRLSPNLPMGLGGIHFPPRETSSSDDDSSLDLHMDTDFPQTRVSLHMNPHPLLHGLNLRLSRYPVRSNFYSSGNGRPTSRHRRRVADFETHFLNWGNRSDLFGLVDTSEDSYEAFLGLAELTGDVPRGLQRTEINRLPTRKYTTPNGVSSSKGAEIPHKRAELNKECQVCLNDYVNGDILRILPCFHEFHTPCIDPWLKINHTCPVCRVIVNLEE